MQRMTQTITGIVKKDRVRVAEPCRIGAAAQGGAAAAGAGAMVRIARRNADHAVLEVRCACGRTTHVECRWPAGAPGDEPDDPTPDAQNRSDNRNKEVP
jgi:hypothetical protein